MEERLASGNYGQRESERLANSREAASSPTPAASSTGLDLALPPLRRSKQAEPCFQVLVQLERDTDNEGN